MRLPLNRAEATSEHLRLIQVAAVVHRGCGLLGGVDEGSGHAVVDEFRHRPGDDGCAAGYRLDDGQPERLGEGDRVQQGVSAAEHGRP